MKTKAYSTYQGGDGVSLQVVKHSSMADRNCSPSFFSNVRGTENVDATRYEFESIGKLLNMPQKDLFLQSKYPLKSCKLVMHGHLLRVEQSRGWETSVAFGF
jgi:hypothetical protein